MQHNTMPQLRVSAECLTVQAAQRVGLDDVDWTDLKGNGKAGGVGRCLISWPTQSQAPTGCPKACASCMQKCHSWHSVTLAFLHELMAAPPGVSSMQLADSGVFECRRCLEIPGSAQFNPLKFVHGLAEAFVSAGGRIFEQTHMESQSLGGHKVPRTHTDR